MGKGAKVSVLYRYCHPRPKVKAIKPNAGFQDVFKPLYVSRRAKMVVSGKEQVCIVMTSPFHHEPDPDAPLTPERAKQLAERQKKKEEAQKKGRKGRKKKNAAANKDDEEDDGPV